MRPGRAGMTLLMLALGACTSSTDQGPPPVVLTGTWGYAGTQTVPSAQLAGTLVVSSQAGHTFTGSFAATESGPGIPTNSLSGTVQGRALDSVGLDFNVVVNGVARRHVGLVHGDSLTGNWAVENDPAASAAGTFRMRRLSSP